MSEERILPPAVAEFALEERRRLLDQVEKLKAERMELLDINSELRRRLAKQFKSAYEANRFLTPPSASKP